MAPHARAESGLELPYPEADSFGEFSASTSDDAGRRVGGASIRLERLENGHVTVRLRGGFDGGARIELDAELEPTKSGAVTKLRILHERSQSFDPEGKPLVILTIDHQKAEARCTPPAEDSGKASVVALSSPDRVVNVPLNLLFRLLGFEGVDVIETQAFFCLGGARVMGFVARMVGDEEVSPDLAGRSIREVSYGPDGKSFFSWAAKALAPKISFWMDVNHGGAYIAHRMPLYSQGPVVYVVLDGIEPGRVIPR